MANGGLNGVTPEMKSPNPVMREAEPRALAALVYEPLALEPWAYDTTWVANGDATADAPAVASARIRMCFKPQTFRAEQAPWDGSVPNRAERSPGPEGPFAGGACIDGDGSRGRREHRRRTPVREGRQQRWWQVFRLRAPHAEGLPGFGKPVTLLPSLGEKLGGFDTRYGGASAVDFHHTSLFTEALAPAPSAGRA